MKYKSFENTLHVLFKTFCPVVISAVISYYLYLYLAVNWTIIWIWFEHAMKKKPVYCDFINYSWYWLWSVDVWRYLLIPSWLINQRLYISCFPSYQWYDGKQLYSRWFTTSNTVSRLLISMLLSEWVSEWVSACCLTSTQLYHGKNKIIFNKMMMRSALY